jgi:hypothetical protein
MNRLLDDLQKKEDCADGESTMARTGETTQKTYGRQNGVDGDLRIMQHFLRDFIEWPDDAGPLR